MRNRIVNLVALGATLVLVGLIALWMRSYWGIDELAIVGSGKLSFMFSQGELWVETCSCFYFGPYDEQTRQYGSEGSYANRTRVILRHHDLEPTGEPEPCEGSDSVEEGSPRITYESRHARARIPLWVPTAIAGLSPLVTGLKKLRRRSLRRRGCCEGCGYDLRATPARCPECGAEPHE